ncbi:hypothetical protein [Nocardioides pakistanensis]
MSTNRQPKTPKVFAVRIVRGAGFPGDLRQPTMLVAASSRAAAVRAFNAAGARITDSFLRDYGSETGNDHHIAVATSQPGTVFCAVDDRHPATFEPVPARTS